MSAGVTPASANAIGPERAAPEVVRSKRAAGEMLHRFAGADDFDQRPVELFGDLRPHQHKRAAAVADDAAIEPVQRIGDQRRAHDVLDGHDLGQHGVRIVLRVVRSRDLDPGKLLAGGAVLVHVPHRAHGVAVRRGDGVRRLPSGLGLVGGSGPRRRAGRHAFAARPPRERDQRDVAFAGSDRLGRMRGERDVGGAAKLGGFGMAKLQVHVFRHGGGAGARRIAGAEIAVDVVAGEPGIGQRAQRHLGVELRHGLVRRMPRRMLERAGDIRLALDAHAWIPRLRVATYRPSARPPTSARARLRAIGRHGSRARTRPGFRHETRARSQSCRPLGRRQRGRFRDARRA